MTTLFFSQSKGCVHSRKKVEPLMKTLFSLKGMCAFNEECGAPSPCFPIKGGGEPHFWVFTFWEGETLALPYLNPFIPPSSSRVRVRAFVVARVLASLWCSCSSSSWCSSARARGRRSMLAFFGIRRLRLRLHVCLRVRCLLLDYLFLPHPTISFHLSFVLHTHVRACVLLESLPL